MPMVTAADVVVEREIENSCVMVTSDKNVVVATTIVLSGRSSPEAASGGATAAT